MKQSLRGRLIAAVAPLLRHRATDIRARFPHGFRVIDPRFGQAGIPKQVLNDRLAGFAGRVIANVDVAIAHDRYPLLKVYVAGLRQRTTAQKSCMPLEFESTAPGLWFTVGGCRPAASG